MAAAGRNVEVASTKSMYEEMYGSEPDDDAPAEPASSGRVRRPRSSRAAAAEPAVAVDPAPKARPKKAVGKRPDAEGMRRWSLYSTEASAAAFDDAVAKIRDAMGGDVPKQVVISALLEHAAAGADQGADVLIELQAQELEDRLATLRSRN
jgi:hypothetical protein